jgi:imidazolonepropionase
MVQAGLADPESQLIQGISELVTNDPAAGPGLLGIVPKAAVIIQDGHVAWMGPAASAPAADTAIDLQGRAVLPGWVDSDTHLIFARDGVADFTARVSGGPAAGNGLQVMVDATRAAADRDLLTVARWHRGEMLTGGTTCAETKTGYGLTVRDEARLAATAKAAGFDEITFHGAYAVPPGYGKDPDGYLDLVCGPMLDAAAPLVRWLSVSCDGDLDSAQARRVLAAGQRKGLGLRVQGNQTGPGPAAMIAVDTGAAAVDHCNHLTDTDIIALAGSSTVATLLPTADLLTGQPPAPGRRLIDAGVSIALASGADPGTSYTSSMNLVVALAVLRCGLTPAEAVYAATAGGARALRRTDVGTLTVRARADLHVLNAPSHAYLAYRPGMPLTHSVYQHGSRVPTGRGGAGVDLHTEINPPEI